MFKSFVTAVLLAAAALVLGCSTPTRINAQWVNPEFAGKRPVRSIMIVAAVRDTATRRIYEDRMTASLTALGVSSSPTPLGSGCSGNNR